MGIPVGEARPPTAVDAQATSHHNTQMICGEFGKLLLDPLGVSLQEFIVGVVQRLLRGQLVVDRQPELLLFQELDFGDKIGELLKYVRN